MKKRGEVPRQAQAQARQAQKPETLTVRVFSGGTGEEEQEDRELHSKERTVYFKRPSLLASVKCAPGS